MKAFLIILAIGAWYSISHPIATDGGFAGPMQTRPCYGIPYTKEQPFQGPDSYTGITYCIGIPGPTFDTPKRL